MSSMLNSQGVALVTAMAAVSGTVIVLSLCLQRSLPTTQFPVDRARQPSSPTLRSCISSDGKNKEKKKKKVRFAEDVVEPSGDGKEFRKQRGRLLRKNRGMPENRVALYTAILRDRDVQRLTHCC